MTISIRQMHIAAVFELVKFAEYQCKRREQQELFAADCLNSLVKLCDVLGIIVVEERRDSGRRDRRSDRRSVRQARKAEEFCKSRRDP